MSNKNNPHLLGTGDGGQSSGQGRGEKVYYCCLSAKTPQVLIIFQQKMLVCILWSAVQRRVNRLGLGENKNGVSTHR